MDALFFMTVCSGAAVLLFSVSGAYNANTNKQITSMYNYEFANTALISLHYAKYADAGGSEKWFWIELCKKLAKDNPGDEVKKFLESNGVWEDLKKMSPSPSTHLCFSSEDAGVSFCVPDENPQLKTIYTALMNTKDSTGDRTWTVWLKLSY